MRISELSKAAGVDLETVRYYEKVGLLPAPARRPNGYRAYGPEHLKRLTFIRHCRTLDIRLADVRRLLDFITHPEADCGDINRLIEEHLARVRTQLKGLRALERQLVDLRAQCRAERTARHCGILQKLASGENFPQAARKGPRAGARSS